ncbi:hypothetical protein ACQ4M4_22485 [Leptolyngbya sp. AN02str]|uniref:hypothetical protein n=1 Tax=Leptolyngbya sp. AN02str TaxID=3423363 RepID=UPI003D30F5AA
MRSTPRFLSVVLLAALSSAVGLPAVAQVPETAVLYQSFLQAVCTQNWGTALQRIDSLIASNQVPATYRTRLQSYRGVLSGYRSSNARFLRVAGCADSQASSDDGSGVAIPATPAVAIPAADSTTPTAITSTGEIVPVAPAATGTTPPANVRRPVTRSGNRTQFQYGEVVGGANWDRAVRVINIFGPNSWSGQVTNQGTSTQNP